jgi:uncharacterized membrane protein
MNPIIDGVMLILFVLFMIFIFGGYHKNKSAAREAEKKDQKGKAENKETTS